MKTTRPKSYQMGAAHERQAILAYLGRLGKKVPLDSKTMYDVIVKWVEGRVARFSAKPGGLGRKRKVRVITYVFGAKAAK